MVPGGPSITKNGKRQRAATDLKIAQVASDVANRLAQMPTSFLILIPRRDVSDGGNLRGRCRGIAENRE
jgi:hypothetical protein